MPSILRGNQIDVLQNTNSPVCDISKVSYRGGNQIQNAFRIGQFYNFLSEFNNISEAVSISFFEIFKCGLNRIDLTPHPRIIRPS